MSSLTEAKGLFSNCGPGIDTFELSYTCKGPSCSSITNFQNVKCNSNGGGGSSVSCSNDIKCPPGISSYRSNFTFSQNAPDPKIPAPNQPDNLIKQQQDVLIPDCRKFSVKSDGTKQGTSTDAGTDVDCGVKVQSTPTPSAGAKAATSTIAGFKPSSTSSPQQFTGKSPSRHPSKNVLFFTFLFGLMLFLPGVQAYKPNKIQERHAELRARAELRVRALSDKVRAFATQFDTDLAAKANAEGNNGNSFAHNLVADVVTSCGKLHA
ncbi:uncharacterized protein BDR25DRAFT_309806 [Lindgomyces ingoldianus]|uniref:Uncharacterized protein n=1 Tax=Lindgomyces ingoldianus TaxID=673940 RepID=A0ACB6RCB7_9PLEO|nr:uncharacterized protein BDR25DRAFT_309806 [Lindgomyces ingoldianus]KAF2476408.1 hypothetical protein BDR25DRAFT_309806 [Lindgomyces ingoldianus]